MPITSLNQLNEFFADGRGEAAIRPIIKYYPNNIVSASISIDHDGCDSYGWESDLVTINITANIDGEMRNHQWYFEDWYQEKLPVAELVRDRAA
jgi:hypothetical protein